MKIEIYFIEPSEKDIYGGWTVSYGDKYAEGLVYDEMFGLVASITMPKERPCLQWLKTEAQHQAWRDALKKMEPLVEVYSSDKEIRLLPCPTH